MELKAVKQCRAGCRRHPAAVEVEGIEAEYLAGPELIAVLVDVDVVLDDDGVQLLNRQRGGQDTNTAEPTD